MTDHVGYTLRIPTGLHRQLKASSERARRSLHAEILTRLELSLQTVEIMPPVSPYRVIGETTEDSDDPREPIPGGYTVEHVEDEEPDFDENRMALDPACTNAGLHWRLSSNEQCRYCKGVAP